jgi:hypothetical protein
MEQFSLSCLNYASIFYMRQRDTFHPFMVANMRPLAAQAFGPLYLRKSTVVRKQIWGMASKILCYIFTPFKLVLTLLLLQLL